MATSITQNIPDLLSIGYGITVIMLIKAGCGYYLKHFFLLILLLLKSI